MQCFWVVQHLKTEGQSEGTGLLELMGVKGRRCVIGNLFNDSFNGDILHSSVKPQVHTFHSLYG